MNQASEWYQQEAARTFGRILPRLQPVIDTLDDPAPFLKRLDTHFPDVFRLLHMLYGHQYDFFYYLEEIMASTVRMYAARPTDLRELDAKREADPHWYQSETMMGAVCYVDLFAGNIHKLEKKIPYLKELGIRYLHLMPLFKSPEKNNDGGYAVSDYRTLKPETGTMEQLQHFAQMLRENDISLVLDFIFNHTSNEHTWVQRAKAGEKEYERFYHMFDDRTLPDQYERTLREIFPEQAPRNFTWDEDLQKWVWTTFYNFQWDLNYSNPAVLNAMMQEMLYLANQGVEVLRLDAVAFIWKQMGTSCEGLPQAHWIVQALNHLVRIVSPAMIFKSEAIVHPAEVASYIREDECPISYNPTLMALLWEAIATREVKLLRHSMIKRFDIPADCAWVNYVRVHDDIGWTFADEDAWEIGINGFDHRQFLNQFYTGSFEGSFAKGVPFNYNPETRDMRISGTAASLAGLEQAIELENDLYTEHAIKRILLIHSIILSAGGIPLLYLGDELGTLNDYSYQSDPDKQTDSRWVHRPAFDWERAKRRNKAKTIEGQIFQSLQHMIQIRQRTPAFAGNKSLFFDTDNPHVLAYLRNKSVLILANFSEHPQDIERAVLDAYVNLPDSCRELLDNEKYSMLNQTIHLEAYQYLWLQIQGGEE